VTRGQMVTFLWRLAGRPDPGDAPHFDDIDPTASLSAPTRWARLAGVTTGVSGGNRFAPVAPVTRGQMVTFLHRFAGQPPTAETREFLDVAPTAFYSLPTRWAREHAVTSGVTSARFGPDSQLTRSQMALFLQRFALAPASRGPGSQPVVVR
jgi:hypothetical protein